MHLCMSTLCIVLWGWEEKVESLPPEAEPSLCWWPSTNELWMVRKATAGLHHGIYREEAMSQIPSTFSRRHTEYKSQPGRYLWSLDASCSDAPSIDSRDWTSISFSLPGDCPLVGSPAGRGWPLVDGCKRVLWKEWKDSSSSEPPVLSWPVSLSCELAWLRFPDDPKRLLSTGL